MRCNNCGWENPDENQKCEKCNAPLQSGVSISEGPNIPSGPTIPENGPFQKPQQPGKTIPDTIPDSKPTSTTKTNGTTDFGGTINPFGPGSGFTPVPRCILKPVIFPGEDARYAPQQVNIKGGYNELNRQILDPDNTTITSKVQAKLTHKDGKWYIQNQSVQKTTYVYAGEPIEVKSGDVILMGNRTFVFEED